MMITNEKDELKGAIITVTDESTITATGQSQLSTSDGNQVCSNMNNDNGAGDQSMVNFSKNDNNSLSPSYVAGSIGGGDLSCEPPGGIPRVSSDSGQKGIGRIKMKSPNFEFRDDEQDDQDVGDEETPQRVKELLEAAENNDLARVKEILKQDPDLVNQCDIDGYTALHRACYNGNTRVVAELLKRGANPRARTNEGWEPIHCAVKWSHVKSVSLLLQNGADPNAKTQGDQTVLHIAAMNARPKNRLVLELLLWRNDIDVHARNSQGETAYQVAYRSGPFHPMWHHVPGFNIRLDS